MVALSFKKTIAIATPSHIVFLCSRLDMPGGIERAVVNTANLLAIDGYGVTVLIVDETDPSFYPLHEKVKVSQVVLDFGITEKGNVITRKLRFYNHVGKLKKVLQSLAPHTVIGTEYSLTIAAYLAAKDSGINIYAWEHHHFHWLGKSRFWQVLCRTVYPKLQAVICLNDAEQTIFQQAGCRTVVIPNFVRRQEKASLQTKTLLSVGWLIHRKGFDQIPSVAQKIIGRHPDWQWKIIGTGAEKEAVERAIAEKNLSGHVSILPPLSADMGATYASASLYVMTSRFECFPMVLLEAMSHGVPAVSFDCPTGPAFIISNNVDGELIAQDDTDAMAAALLELMGNEKGRIAFGDAAYRNIERFSPERINALWKELLK